MKRAALKLKGITSVLAFAFCTLFSAPASAKYLIPYQLYLPEYGPRGQWVSVLVILADHYSHYFGGPDALDSFLARNEAVGMDGTIAYYREYLHDWYKRQVLKPENLKRMRVTREQMERLINRVALAEDRLSSDIIITGHHDFTDIRAMMRTTVEDEEGFLPEERVFFEAGLIPRFPNDPEPTEGVIEFPNFELVDQGLAERVNLGWPIKNKLVHGPIGGNIAGKNLGVDDETLLQLLPRLLQIAWMHKTYSLTAKRDRNGRGVFAKRIFAGCTGDRMRSFLNQLKFETWDHINHPLTEHTDAWLMQSDPRTYTRGLNTFFTMTASRALASQVLLYDWAAAMKLRHPPCVRELLTSGRQWDKVQIPPKPGRLMPRSITNGIR